MEPTRNCAVALPCSTLPVMRWYELIYLLSTSKNCYSKKENLVVGHAAFSASFTISFSSLHYPNYVGYLTGYPSIHWTESDKSIHRSTFLYFLLWVDRREIWGVLSITSSKIFQFTIERCRKYIQKAPKATSEYVSYYAYTAYEYKHPLWSSMSQYIQF